MSSKIHSSPRRLRQLKAGARGRLAWSGMLDASAWGSLANLGLIPGAEIEVVRQTAGPWVLRVRHGSVIVGRSLVDLLEIEPLVNTAGTATP